MIHFINWAFERRNLDPVAKFVLVCLADYANPDGHCWPSQRAIAGRTGYSERAVRAAAARLEGIGLISRLARRNEKNEPISDYFQLCAPLPDGGAATYRTEVPLVAERRAATYRNDAPDLAARGAADPVIDPSSDPPIDPMGDLFEKFWKAYPRKAAKGYARKAFRTLRPSVALADRLIADAVERFKITEKHLIPHPATYLRGEYWEAPLGEENSWADMPRLNPRPESGSGDDLLSRLAKNVIAKRDAELAGGR